VTYNVFVTRVDNFNYMMDEASYEAIQLLSASVESSRGLAMLKKKRRSGSPST
jgi:hypothetical protein